MIVCVAVIKFKLFQAFRVRKPQAARSARDSRRAAEGLDNTGRSSKDFRVIQSVALICCIFIVSQLPFLVYSTVRLINPEFDIFRRLQNLFFIFTTLSRTCSYLNASMNIFVYYNYNSRYRATFLAMFKSKRNNSFKKPK
ncbi:chemosensory receptor a [Plakobranchus ocellatus]|uniref:Chemosensory receptor a n=1 Tax=Plakobranchus ocellatus TaxID=259542 RepID=A0AAV3ZQP8_9GAST|nr:chemosensory receptor a [Plakobranchus ocellatus]